MRMMNDFSHRTAIRPQLAILYLYLMMKLAPMIDVLPSAKSGQPLCLGDHFGGAHDHLSGFSAVAAGATSNQLLVEQARTQTEKQC